MATVTIIEAMLQSGDAWNRVAHYTQGIFKVGKREVNRRDAGQLRLPERQSCASTPNRSGQR